MSPAYWCMPSCEAAACAGCPLTPKSLSVTLLCIARPRVEEDTVKITGLESLFVEPRWHFLKMHTDKGIVGLGEPIVEGRSTLLRR